jgi:hypothetical protein
MNIFNQGATMLSKFTLSLLLSIPAIMQGAEPKDWVNVKCITKVVTENLGIEKIPVTRGKTNYIDVRETLAKTFNVSYNKVTLVLWGKVVSDYEDPLTDLDHYLNQVPDNCELIALIDKH